MNDSANIFSDEHMYTQKELLGQACAMTASLSRDLTAETITIASYPLKNNGAKVVVEILDPRTYRPTGFGYTADVYAISGRSKILSKLKEMFSAKQDIRHDIKEVAGVEGPYLL